MIINFERFIRLLKDPTTTECITFSLAGVIYIIVASSLGPVDYSDMNVLEVLKLLVYILGACCYSVSVIMFYFNFKTIVIKYLKKRFDIDD